MKQLLSIRITPWTVAALIAGGLIALTLIAYGTTRLMSANEVMGRVTVAETDLGGLDRDQALTAMITVEDLYMSRPAVFTVERKVVSMQPTEAGLTVDSEAIVDDALAVGRSGNPFGEFWWWLTHIFSTVEVPVQGSIDEQPLNEVFDKWDTEVIASPASPGGLTVASEEVVPVYPRTGTGVDRAAASPIVEFVLLTEEPEQVEIPTTVIEPRLTNQDVDAALELARALVGDSIEMVYNGSSIVFTPDELLAALVSDTVVEGDSASIETYFDPAVIDEYLTPVREEFEDEPVNARHSIEGERVVVIPGSKGTRIDEVTTAERMATAGLTPSRTGELPIVEGADPDITTEYLESLNVNHLVAQFTTYHSCCAPRVTNIQTFAASIDQALVLPGEVFSLNEYVGERTEEKGYEAAPTIVAGQLEDTVGGGVSQFATTFYNAVFWGGYEDIEHKPHSYYFSRYPEGIEATINWRTPDLRFRNNRDHAILIDTFWTDTSITVRFFGENDGRTLKGEQSGGVMRVWASTEGGPEALHVKGSVSDRYAETEPGDPQYIANPDLGVNQQVQVQSESGGWSVRVTRTILRGGTDIVEEREWVVRYAPRFAVIEVHPCKVPGSGVSCPAPSTTTTVPGTTTTTSGGTTTTTSTTTTTTPP